MTRDPHDVRHGDTWETRDGRATIIATNDWPAPTGLFLVGLLAISPVELRNVQFSTESAVNLLRYPHGHCQPDQLERRA